MLREIVDGAIHRPARLQLPQMADEQVRLIGVRAVVIDGRPLLVGAAHLFFVIIVMAQHGDGVSEALRQAVRQGAFSAARTARNADHKRFCHNIISRISISPSAR